jgi:hypothetical protein
MHNLDEKIISLKKYFRKLLYVLNNDHSFTFIKTRLVDKKKIDHVICCIEASFPQEYKDFVKVKRNNLRTDINYMKLLKAIKNHFWLNSSMYKVYYQEAGRYINAILSSIETDMQYVISNPISKF